MQKAALDRVGAPQGLRQAARLSSAAVGCPLLSRHTVAVHRRPALQPPAAAAAVVDVVPYISSVAPKLRGRSISGNPLEWAWACAAAGATRLELMSAASVDRFTDIGPPLLAALAGATTALGVDGLTLLQHGLPPYFQDWLVHAFGIWNTELARLVLAVVAAPAAAWALRCWWVANMQLLNSPGGLVQHLLHPQQQQQQSQQQQQQQDDLGNWVVLGLVAARVLCLGTAVSRVALALASTSATAAGLNAAAAFAAATVAAAPLLLQLALFGSSDAGSSSSSSSRSSGGGGSSDNASLVRATALTLLAEVSWLVAMLGVAPLMNAAAGVAIAASLLLLHRQLVAPRLLRYQAALGDAAEVHVSLRLAGSTAVFDSTLAEQPLPIVVVQRPAWHEQLWQEVSRPGYWNDNEQQQQQQQQQQEAKGMAAAAAGSSSSGGGQGAEDAAAAAAGGGSGDQERDSHSLFAVQRDVQAWLADPAGRWEVLLPFIADAAAGMYLGQRRSVALFNPLNVGYWNPRFTWWQPTDDVLEKFKGQTFEPGDTFWYPVAEGASVPTRVASIGEQYVELDANYGVVGAGLQLEVQLVRLYKADEVEQQAQEQQEAQEADAAAAPSGQA